MCWAAGEHKAAVGAKARAKEARPGAISPTAAGSAGGEAEMKVDVAMPLAPHAGAVGKEKARAAPDEGPSPRGGRSRFSGEPIV